MNNLTYWVNEEVKIKFAEKLTSNRYADTPSAERNLLLMSEVLEEIKNRLQDVLLKWTDNNVLNAESMIHPTNEDDAGDVSDAKLTQEESLRKMKGYK